MLYEALQKENLASDQDLDLDDITNTGPARCPTAPNQKSKPFENPNPIGGLSLNQLQERANQVITYEWVRGDTPMKELIYEFSFCPLWDKAGRTLSSSSSEALDYHNCNSPDNE